MTERTKGIAGGVLACMMIGAAAVGLPAPAMAQDRDRLEVFGPGERGWFEDRDSYLRGQYERGYRMGREDERRAREQASLRQYDQAMEYLDQARRQIRNGELREAWVALGRAETRLLTRVATADRDEQAATGGAIGAIREARRALEDQRPGHARDRVARAETLVERGRVIGATVPGARLSSPGRANEADFSSRDRDWTSGGDAAEGRR
jgi:tetratricopeptide (TPR) repeat protein